MFRNIKDFKSYEKDSQLSTRVIILSIPSALLFITLTYFRILSPATAFLCYAVILIFNMFSLFPLSYEMRSLRKYIYSLVNEKPDTQPLELLENDTKEIAEAINSMHRFWSSQTDTLKAQTISDAAVLDTLPDPIIMIDNEGNITGSNSAARQLFGNSMLMHNIDTLFNVNIFIKSVEKILLGKSESESLVFSDSQHQKQRFYAHITRLPWFANGRAAAVISLYDISKAASLEKMQSDFVANASHELRTPLSIISGFIETLQTSAKDDEEARENFLNIMKEQATYMSSLIENLLSLSRLEMAQNTELKDKVDLGEIVDDAVNALKIKAFNRSLNIKQIETVKIPKIIGSIQEIKQIIQNLLDNAIKYAQENTEVTIEMKVVNQIPANAGQNVAQGRAVSIAINNKGPKINKEDLKHLTEKFYRMQIHKDMHIKGTGLGLAIAKQVILHHRGNLTVTSTTYNGTTFTIYLPIKQN
ncbi:MAG: PAS domain-containing protein [Alphaproteobacteria bacterium]|nr:PAS domain-containing protein [Alphaproteobacteria bacterium]